VFTVPAAEACRAAATLRSARARIGFTTCGVTDKVALIILDGAGLRTDPQVIVTFCGSLILSGVRLSLVSAEAGHITAVCPENRLPAVVAALREAFEIHPIDEVPDRDRAAAPLAS
jgi:aspartate kinase